MEIKKIAVIGAGIMGNGIAQVCAQSGFQVSMRDIDQKCLDKGMKKIEKNLSKAVAKEKMSQEDMDKIMGNLTPVLDLKEAVDGADLVIEAATENIDIKKAIFKEIDEVCPPEPGRVGDLLAGSLGTADRYRGKRLPGFQGN